MTYKKKKESNRQVQPELHGATDNYECVQYKIITH